MRVEGYPDRVVYAITAAGREAAREWLREMLRTTHNEYPDFLAAVSILFALHPDEARAAARSARAEKLASELADTEATLKGAPAELPRLFLLEEEYRRAVLEAELALGARRDRRPARGAPDLERAVAARDRGGLQGSRPPRPRGATDR